MGLFKKEGPKFKKVQPEELFDSNTMELDIPPPPPPDMSAGEAPEGVEHRPAEAVPMFPDIPEKTKEDELPPPPSQMPEEEEERPKVEEATANQKEQRLEELRKRFMPHERTPTGIPPLGGVEEKATPSREDIHDKLTQALEPVFMSMADYDSITNNMGEIRSALNRSTTIAKKLEDLKDKKDNKLKQWQKGLEDVQKKLNFLDAKMFEA